MSRADVASTLTDLEYAVEVATRAYGIAQRAASQLNSRKSGAAAIKAHKVMIAAKAALAAASDKAAAS